MNTERTSFDPNTAVFTDDLYQPRYIEVVGTTDNGLVLSGKDGLFNLCLRELQGGNSEEVDSELAKINSQLNDGIKVVFGVIDQDTKQQTLRPAFEARGFGQRKWGEGVVGNRNRTESTTPVRDVLYRLFDLEPGDSAIEQYKTGFWEMGQAIKKGLPVWGRSMRNVTEGLTELTVEAVDKVDPAVRKTVVVGVIGGAALAGLLNTGVNSGDIQVQQAKVEHVQPSQKALNFTFIASQTRTVQGIANELGTTKKQILKLNPELQDGQKILAGEKVKVSSLATTVHLDTLTPIQEVAKKNGLTVDAIRSTNQLTRKDGALFLSGEVTLPGRIVLNIDGQPDVQAVADQIGVSHQVMANMNKYAASGTLVVPLGTARLAPPQIKQISQTVAAPGSTTNEAQPSTTTISDTTSTEAPNTTTTAPETTTTIPSTTTTTMPFDAQTTNPEMGKRPNNKEIDASNTCNLTAVTESLQFLGLINPASIVDGHPVQLVVNTYLQEIAPKGIDITDPRAWKQTAELFGATTDMQHIQNTRDFWQNAKAQLDAGKTAILSISGHIVQLHDITDQGIVVNDPEGSSILLTPSPDGGYAEPSNPNVKNSKYHYIFASRNSSDPAANAAEQPGYKHEWSWVDVYAYQHFSQIMFLSNPNNSITQDAAPTTSEAPTTIVTTTVPEATTTTTTPSAEVQPTSAEQYGLAQQAVLDEIASGEGSWDSFNFHKAGDAHGHFVLKDGRTITQLTIAEVMSMQQKQQLFAVGRYQFIPGTLQSAVKSTGIDTSRLYDAAAQNELAVNYLLLTKRPALADYLLGKHDNVHAAAEAAAMEWASLPYDFGHGVFRSFYHGSANNHAKGGAERFQQFCNLLTNLRDAREAADKAA